MRVFKWMGVGQNTGGRGEKREVIRAEDWDSRKRSHPQKIRKQHKWLTHLLIRIIERKELVRQNTGEREEERRHRSRKLATTRKCWEHSNDWKTTTSCWLTLFGTLMRTINESFQVVKGEGKGRSLSEIEQEEREETKYDLKRKMWERRRKKSATRAENWRFVTRNAEKIRWLESTTSCHCVRNFNENPQRESLRGSERENKGRTLPKKRRICVHGKFSMRESFAWRMIELIYVLLSYKLCLGTVGGHWLWQTLSGSLTGGRSFVGPFDLW